MTPDISDSSSPPIPQKLNYWRLIVMALVYLGVGLLGMTVYGVYANAGRPSSEPPLVHPLAGVKTIGLFAGILLFAKRSWRLEALWGAFLLVAFFLDFLAYFILGVIMVIIVKAIGKWVVSVVKFYSRKANTEPTGGPSSADSSEEY